MKYLLIAFSLLTLAFTAKAQVKTNQVDCDCSPTPSITGLAGVSATATSVKMQYSCTFNYQLIIFIKDTSVGASSFSTGTGATNGETSTLKTCNITNLTPGHTYEIKIQGTKTCNDTPDGCKEVIFNTFDSNTVPGVQVLPAAPSTSLTSVTNNSFQISWPATFGTTDYRLDVATNSNFTVFLPGYNGVSVGTATNPLTPVMSGLPPGTQYWYRVRSLNAAGFSAYSTVGSTVTLSNVPSLTAATNVTTTSFTANWNAATGATQYKLDVATNDQFTSFVPGFQDLAVTGTTKTVTGLVAGVNYYYRVKGVNSGGASSASSSFQQQLTFPGKPVPAISSVTTNSFNLNWAAVLNVTNFQLDLATDANFNNIVTGFNSKAVTGTSLVISSLTPGTTYFARLRSVNATGTTQSDPVNTITVSSAPEVLPATEVTTDKFIANWGNTVGAASYRLDVATDEAMTIFLPGFSNLTLTATQKEVPGLEAGKKYYYRVRAVNATATSVNSDVMSQLTYPAVPQNFAIGDLSANPITMKASWKSVVSADEYDIEVSKSVAFDDILPDYNPFVVSSLITEAVLNKNLQPSTVYYIRLRAKNATGFSAYTETKTASTLSQTGGDNFDVKLTNLTAPTSVTPKGNSTITFNLDGGAAPLQTTLYHRKKTQIDFTTEAVSTIKGLNTLAINDDWFDDFGMEFFIESTDNAGHIQRSTTKTILVHIPEVKVTPASFGKDISNYHIISIPYDLASKKVGDVFETALGGYIDTQWRLMRYKDGKNQDYRDGLSVSNIERGLGYWFISANYVDLTFGQANTFDNSIDQPFKLSLKKGWNQIGDPFNKIIQWTDLMAVSDNAGLPIGKFIVFSNEKTSFEEGHQLKPFEGGFVYADDNTTLTFPVTIPSSSGRKQNGREEMVSGDWMLPIQLVQNNVVNDLSGIGMHHAASDDKDRMDLPVPPSFMRYVEFSSEGLSQNIVKTKDSFRWDFELTSDSKNPVTLKWDNTNLDGQFIMHDKHANKLINMNKVSSCVASPSSEISIYYDRNKKFEETEIALGIAYPNPFKEMAIIPYDYAQSNAMFVVTDLNGAEVIRFTSLASEIEWNGKNSQGGIVPPGLYIYRIYTGSTVYTGKIIKQ